jgi:hypothetical protein
MEQKPTWGERVAFRGFSVLANSRFLWSLVTKLGRVMQKFHPLVKGGPLDPARAWTRTRELPPVARQSFKEYWRTRP